MDHISNLNMLKSKKSIDKHDFLRYLKTVATISKNFSDYKIFLASSRVLKEWISSFLKIFSKSKCNADLKNYISKTCYTITKLYSKLSECFHQFEPNYIQEFYSHWKAILYLMNASSRAKSCVQNIDRLKITVGHLRTARHRLEQITIYDVLRSYTETLCIDKLNELKINHDGPDLNAIIEITEMEKKASLKSLHTFLTSINMNGNNILTVKPIRISPVNFKLKHLNEKHVVWLDFNLKNNSITFVALSLIHHELICLGIVAFPELSDYVLQETYQIVVRGTWNFWIKNGQMDANTGTTLEIVFLCQPNVKDKVLQLNDVFKFTSLQGYEITAVKDKNDDLETLASKTICFNDHIIDDYDDAATRPTAAKVARTNSRSSLSDGYNSDEMPTSSWSWFVKDGKESELFNPESKHIHGIRPSTTDYDYPDDSLRVNYNSNAVQQNTTKNAVNNVDYKIELSKGKVTWESCVPQQIEADTNASPPELPNFSSHQEIPGQIKTRRLTYVISKIEEVYTSLAVNCGSRDNQLQEIDDLAASVKNNTQVQKTDVQTHGPVDRNSDYNESIGLEKSNVIENFHEHSIRSARSSSISHQSICDNKNDADVVCTHVPITLHLETILNTLKKLQQCVERISAETEAPGVEPCMIWKDCVKF